MRQVSDGAAAVLLMTRREAQKRGLPVLGVFRSFSVVGVDPAIMGIGPAVAIPAAVEKAGLRVSDIDLFELNEAFASQVLTPLRFFALLHVRFYAQITSSWQKSMGKDEESAVYLSWGQEAEKSRAEGGPNGRGVASGVVEIRLGHAG